MYVLGVVKLFDTPDAGLILIPVWVMVGTRAVTDVPKGTVTEIVWAPSSIVVPVDVGKVKAVIAFADDGVTVTVTT